MDLLKCAVASLIETYAHKVFTTHQSQTSSHFFIGFQLFIAQYIALKLYHVFIYPFYVSPLRHIPGPKNGNIFFGQTFNLLRENPGDPQLSWCRQYPNSGLIRYLGIGNSEYILLNSPKAHREVLQTKCYSFVKPGWLARVVGEITGSGLLFAEGDAHKKQRKLLAGPFTFGNMRNLLPFFDAKAIELASVIRRRIGSADDFTSMEFTSLLLQTTMDIIGLAVLGYELNSLSTSSALANYYDTVLTTNKVGQLISVIHQAVPIRWALPIKANLDFINANAQIRIILREHIRRRREEMAGNLESSSEDEVEEDLLTLMIKEKFNASDGWTDDEILGHLLNFMAAGHETTAGALTWALHLLTVYPEIQTRLRKEIKDETEQGVTLTTVKIDSLKFLNNFTREVLRYYSPAISTPREAASDVMIDGSILPKGTNIIIVPSLPQFDVKIWGPTADQFMPDRWDELPKEAQDIYAFQAFLSGPRACIGKAFALLEFKRILIELVCNFEFSSSRKVEMQKGGVTLRPVGGLTLDVKRVG